MAFYFIPRYLMYAYEQRINQLQFSFIVVIQGAPIWRNYFHRFTVEIARDLEMQFKRYQPFQITNHGTSNVIVKVRFGQ